MKLVRSGVLLVLVMAFSSFQFTDKQYLLGKFNPASDSRFSKLTSQYASGSAMGGFLRTETYEAFKLMSDSARKQGIHLTIISATRNFDSQKAIWENKWNGRVIVEGKNLSTISDLTERAKIILRYSSMPGSSRHHWGTDMDLNSLVNSYFESGEGLKIYNWLQANAAGFGFCQPYTSKTGGRKGYQEEKWHWSYSPLSSGFLRDYSSQISVNEITGFEGSQVAGKVNIIEEYVKGVSCP